MSLGYIQRKSLLYQSGVEYADFCINHVEGCSHGCKYPCYAYMMKKRCGVVKTYEDWCQPKIVSNALELLDKEIPKYKYKIKYVHLCFSTDPFMYNQPEVAELSLKIISLYDDLPNKKSAWIIGDQLIRSITSIGANLVEATASSSRLEFKKFNEISLKSANESKYWLGLLLNTVELAFGPFSQHQSVPEPPLNNPQTVRYHGKKAIRKPRISPAKTAHSYGKDDQIPFLSFVRINPDL